MFEFKRGTAELMNENPSDRMKAILWIFFRPSAMVIGAFAIVSAACFVYGRF